MRPDKINLLPMNPKLKLWEQHPTWREAEQAWEEGAKKQAAANPLKVLSHLPSMPGITEETAYHLKWKSLKYLVTHDKERVIPRHLFKHPLKYGLALLKSCLRKKSYKRDEDFFLYGIQDVAEFKKLIENPDSILVVGFSYCHKPHECPSGRFTTACIDPNHPVCRQCFIGKAVNALPEKGI